MSIDIICVTFKDELLMQSVQARSIEKFFNYEDVNQITLILNEWEWLSSKEIDYIKQSVIPNYGRFQNKVKLYFANDFIGKKDEKLGWRSQQYLKLVASQLSRAQFSLILDSKNFFVQPVGMGNFVSNGKAITHWEKRSAMEKYLIPSIEFFGVTDYSEPQVYPCVTPYCVSNKLVQAMMTCATKISETTFEDLFLTQNRIITEFYMIFGYAFKHDLLDDFFSYRERPNFLTLFNLWPSTDAQKEFAYKRADDNDVIAIGIHRNRYKKLTEDEENMITRKFTETAISPNEEDAKKLLSELVNF